MKIFITAPDLLAVKVLCPVVSKFSFVEFDALVD